MSDKDDDKEHEERFARVMKARQAITATLPAWRAGKAVELRGDIACPICGTGRLAYARSGYNGHIRAHCKTPGCVSWVE